MVQAAARGEVSPLVQLVIGLPVVGVGIWLWIARKSLTESYKHMRARRRWNLPWASTADFISTRTGPIFLVFFGLALLIHGAATV